MCPEVSHLLLRAPQPVARSLPPGACHQPCCEYPARSQRSGLAKLFQELCGSSQAPLPFFWTHLQPPDLRARHPSEAELRGSPPEAGASSVSVHGGLQSHRGVGALPEHRSRLATAKILFIHMSHPCHHSQELFSLPNPGPAGRATKGLPQADPRSPQPRPVELCLYCPCWWIPRPGLLSEVGGTLAT